MSRQNWILVFRLCDLDFNTFCNLSRQLGFRHQHSPLSFQPFLSVGSCCACACGIRFTSFHFQDSTWQLSTFSPPWVVASGFPSPQLYSKQDPKKVISPTFCFCNQSGWLQDSRRPLQHEDREETLLVTIITTIHIVKQLCQYLSDMQDTRISKDVPSQAQPAWGYVPWCSLWPYGSFMWGTRKTGWKTGRESSVPVMSGLHVESRPASATAAGAFPASGSAASAFLRFEISARGFLSVKQCEASACMPAYLSFPWVKIP